MHLGGTVGSKSGKDVRQQQQRRFAMGATGCGHGRRARRGRECAPLHGHNAQRNAILRWRFLRQGHHRRIACVTSITLRPSATVIGHPDPPGIRRPGRCSRLLRSRVCNWSPTAAPAPAVLLARVAAPCSMPELFPCPSCAHPMRCTPRGDCSCRSGLMDGMTESAHLGR